MEQGGVLLGLDLGASKVVAVVAVQEGEEGTLKVTGASHANPKGGIRQGEITDISLAVAAIKKAVREAMRTAGQEALNGVVVSVDGIQFKGENLRDSITISTPGREISVDDRERVMDQATNTCKLAREEKVIHKNPQMFHIKGQRDIKNPVGMVGDTLEAEVRIIVAPAPVIENIHRALYLADLDGAKLCYSPLASAMAVLSKEDADNGAVVVDIGEQLTHVGVFMHEALRHSSVISIGGINFTKDMELWLCLGGISVAERIKRLYGTVLHTQVPPEEMIELEDEGRQVSRKELAGVLYSRALDLLNMVQAEIGRSHIPDILGGIHLVGGGSLLPHLPNLAQSVLGRQRVVLGKVSGIQGLPQVVANPLYTNALGAVKLLSEELKEAPQRSKRTNNLFGWLKKWV